MQSLVRPELPTAALRSSQATHAAVDNSAPFATRPESTYKSGKVVQTNGATSVRREVYRSPDLSNPYGSRTNWGEKVFYKLDPNTFMVINVPTGAYDPAGRFPTDKDLIGLQRILATLPSLVSHKFEGALFPIELANGIASMSSYPSAKILERFVENPSLA